MLTQPKRFFSSKLAILCNSRSADELAGRLIDRVQEKHGEVELIGYGGKRLTERGLDSNFNIDLLFDKGFHTFRKTKLWD